jgi:hypothetical protein
MQTERELLSLKIPSALEAAAWRRPNKLPDYVSDLPIFFRDSGYPRAVPATLVPGHAIFHLPHPLARVAFQALVA